MYLQKYLRFNNNSQWIKVGAFFTFFLLFSTSVAAEELSQEGSGVEVNQFSQAGAGFFGLVEQETEGPVNANNRKETLRLLEFGFADLGNNYAAAEEAGITDQLDPDAEIEPAVIGEALIYPSPYSIQQHPQAVLGYKLSKDMEIVIQMYDMMGNMVFKRTYAKSSEGGNSSAQGNKLIFNASTMDGNQFPGGVYFYYILFNNKVLAKGKWAVVP